jgi:hypothetical protein
MQQGWKACPTCGNRVEGDQGASVNILEMFEEMLQTYRRKQAEENNNDSQ